MHSTPYRRARPLTASAAPIGARLCLLPLAFVLSAGLAVLAAFGTHGIDPWLDTAWSYVTIDKGTSNITDLSGRADLWAEPHTYIAAWSELGYGFGAFWNPDHCNGSHSP